MTSFKLAAVQWERDDREVIISASLSELALSSPSRSVEKSLMSRRTAKQQESPLPTLPQSGAVDRPQTPESGERPPPRLTHLQRLTWGYEVVRALDSDDPSRLLRALTGPDAVKQLQRGGPFGYSEEILAHLHVFHL